MRKSRDEIEAEKAVANILGPNTKPNPSKHTKRGAKSVADIPRRAKGAIKVAARGASELRVRARTKRQDHDWRDEYDGVSPLPIEHSPAFDEVNKLRRRRLEREKAIRDSKKIRVVTIPRPPLQEGQPRGILLNPNIYARYKKRVIPPRKPPNLMEDFTVRILNTEIMQCDQADLVQEPARFKPRKHHINSHFEVSSYIKAQHLKLANMARLRVMEFGFLDGLGAKLRIDDRPEHIKNDNYVMQAISRCIYGTPCFGWRILRQAINYVMDHWDVMKYSVKASLLYCSYFFNHYDPDTTDQYQQFLAKWWYRSIHRDRIIDCTIVELTAACQVHQLNLTILEMDVEGRYWFRRSSKTRFKDHCFFYMRAREVHNHTAHTLVWMEQVDKDGALSWFFPNCEVELRWRNEANAFFRFCEVDQTREEAAEPSSKVRKLSQRTIYFSEHHTTCYFYIDPHPGPLKRFCDSICCGRHPGYSDWLFKKANRHNQRTKFLMFENRWRHVHKKRRPFTGSHYEPRKLDKKVRQYLEHANLVHSSELLVREFKVDQRFEDKLKEREAYEGEN